MTPYFIASSGGTDITPTTDPGALMRINQLPNERRSPNTMSSPQSIAKRLVADHFLAATPRPISSGAPRRTITTSPFGHLPHVRSKSSLPESFEPGTPARRSDRSGPRSRASPSR